MGVAGSIGIVCTERCYLTNTCCQIIFCEKLRGLHFANKSYLNEKVGLIYTFPSAEPKIIRRQTQTVSDMCSLSTII